MSGQGPVGIGLSIVGGVIGGYFFGFQGAMIGSSLGGMLGRLIDPPDAPKPPPLGDITVNTYNRNSVLPVAYGQVKASGGVVMRDQGELGWDKDGGGKNEDPTYTIKMSLNWAVAHCEGPILGLASPERFWIDDKYTPRGGEGDEGGAFAFTLHLGASDQAVDSFWTGVYSGQVPPPPLKYTCYHSVWAHIHGSVFSNVPSFSAEIRGFLTEVGEFDANPIRVCFDWLTNERYGIGLPLDMFNGTPDTLDSPWKVASDYCDELVDYIDRNNSIAQEPRFRYSNYVEEKTKGYDFISDIMGSCRGILRYKVGLIEPLIEHGAQVPEYYYSERVAVALLTGGGSDVNRIYGDFSSYPDIYWRGAIGRITIAGETVDFGIKDQTATYIDLCVSLPGDPGVGTSYTITKDNIKEGTFNFKEMGDNSLPNLIRLEYVRRRLWDVNAQAYVNEYQWDTIENEGPEIYTWTATGYRQNIKKIKSVRYSGIKRPTQAMRMAQFHADQIYFARWLCSFTVGIEGFQHAVGDIVGVTHSLPAWNNKQFRIIKMEEQDGGEISLDLSEYNSNVYGDLVNINDYDPNYDDHGGSAWTVPPHVERFSVTQCVDVLDQYKFYIFFKRPDNSNYWYGARVYIVTGSDEYVDAFSVPTSSIKLSGAINYSQTTIPYDPTTLYGTFPTSGTMYIGQELITYTGMSGNSFTGCGRAVNGMPMGHNVNEFCNLLVTETPYILTTNQYAGQEILLKAVSFVSAGISAPFDTAPTYPVYVYNVDSPPPPPGQEGGQ